MLSLTVQRIVDPVQRDSRGISLTTDLSASFVRELTSTRALDEDTLNLKVLNPQLHIFESMYDNRSLDASLLTPFVVYVDVKGIYEYVIYIYIHTLIYKLD